jgi:hypothetical protein
LDEDKKTYKKYALNKDKRLEKLASGPQSSPYYYYTQAEINLHWAIARLKFGDHFTSVKEASLAYKLLIKNEKKFPDFIVRFRVLTFFIL